MKISTITTMIVSGLLVGSAHGAWAQGQDSTPGERNLLVLSEMLPGIYSTANQALFDARRSVAEDARHGNQTFRIERSGEDHQFAMKGDVAGKAVEYRLSLVPGPSALELTAEIEHTDCEINFRRRAEHFDGALNGSGCAGIGFTGMQVSHNEVWVQTAAIDEPFWYERAREFHCYADLPGVSGGRDIPFERYDDIILHDKGGSHTFTTRDEEKRQLTITLQSITWHVLNEDNGNFNRNSLVLYASETMPDGSRVSHPYTFTEPSAERIGYNLRWMLVNCAITPRDEARPEM